MGIEQRELLMPMHHIDRVIDIELNRVRWSAPTIESDHYAHEMKP
jgi:hypothetical protein